MMSDDNLAEMIESAQKLRDLLNQSIELMINQRLKMAGPEGCSFCGADTVMANCRACEGER